MKIVKHLLVSAVALWIVDYLFAGISFDSTQSLVVTVVILGVVNTFIKPLVHFIALPLTILTLGIAAFLVNALLLYLVAKVIPGFNINSYFVALLASLSISLISAFLNKNS